MDAPSPSSDPLPVRWAVILMGALVASALVGALTLAQTASWPGALLAALGAGGSAVLALHQMLGD
ncbi:hypothetical protein AGRA3207_003141 [Actinomadura graeca]|uniref:Uncharacterized protein n=1 Tax=Actinomadura graeca TaxID=2750812 RepID=A0ABX8QTM6_9ACTN|nr:hypothetical protein [Actinomadura graeca]QXJ22180.1 hypothetical protein AGRA3207_003141 [Actinomadura graeca]